MGIEWVAGIDEAGKGPIIGPLVIAIAAIEQEKEQHLKELGVKDSKMLTPHQRDSLVSHIKGWTFWHLIRIEPQEIDEAVFSETLNLNWLEAIHTAKLIDHIAEELGKKHQKLVKVFVDCPSNNIKAYTTYLKSRIHKDHRHIEICAEHKADVNHPIVSAASIIAKTTRDEEIEKLKKKHSVEFGSGYPADPRTKEFVERNFRKYDFFRTSWSTYQKLADKKKQKSLGEF